MNAPEFLHHLAQIGVCVSLGASSSELSIDAPRGTLTPELTELLREHKADLIELVYEREEAAAIEDEGQLSDIGRAYLEAQSPPVTVADCVDRALADVAKVHPGVLALAKVCGGLEIVSVCREAKECAA
ncbi:MAG: hypothetical protein ACR2LC_16700 [Pyrinomonadaceae bacterium]